MFQGFFQKKREDENEPPSKIGKSQDQNVPKVEVLPKFSAEIVQQLEFTSANANLQISTNVTVKTLNTSLKNDVEETKPVINQNLSSTTPNHAAANALPPINSPSMPNPITSFKQEQREYIDVADLQSDMNFDLNDIPQDTFSALISDIISEDNKDSLFHQNHQPPQQLQQQQQQQTMQQRQQLLTHISHHTHQLPHHHTQSQQQQQQQQQQRQQQSPHANNHQHPGSFHPSQIKIEDVNKNNSIKNHNAIPNQQHLPFHLQQSHQLHAAQHMQHQQSHPSGQQIQVRIYDIFYEEEGTVSTINMGEMKNPGYGLSKPRLDKRSKSEPYRGSGQKDWIVEWPAEVTGHRPEGLRP